MPASAGTELMETYVAKDGGSIAGFITIRQNSDESAEIQVMGVSPAHHRQGARSLLMTHAQELTRQRGTPFLQVKTEGPSRPSEGYERTWNFYRAMGFVALEETTVVWGPEHPCLIMIMRL